MTRNFSFYMPTQIRFNCGLFRRLPELAFPGTRALIVTGGNAIHTFGLLNLLRSQLQERHLNAIVWDKAIQLISPQQVMEGAALARAESCNFVIALGGGSCMNAARAIAFMATQEGDVHEYTQEGGRAPMRAPLPLACIPTQAEGMSLLPMSFLRGEDGLHVLQHASMHPAACLLDPDVTLTVPPRATGYHALVALTLASGAMLSNETNLGAVSLAATAWRQLLETIPVCVANGRDAHARCAAAEATLMAGIAAATCPCPPELSLALGLCAAHHELPVGVALALLAPGWHEEAAAVAPQRYRRMQKALGQEVDVARTLQRFCRTCGLNTVLASDYGFNPSTMTLMLRQVEEAIPPVFGRMNNPLTHEERLHVLESALNA